METIKRIAFFYRNCFPWQTILGIPNEYRSAFHLKPKGEEK